MATHQPADQQPAAAAVADVDPVHGLASGVQVLNVFLCDLLLLFWSSETSAKGIVPLTSGSAVSPCTPHASGSSSFCLTPETTAFRCRYPEPTHLDRANQPCSGPPQRPPAPALLCSLPVVCALQNALELDALQSPPVRLAQSPESSWQNSPYRRPLSRSHGRAARISRRTSTPPPRPKRTSIPHNYSITTVQGLASGAQVVNLCLCDLKLLLWPSAMSAKGIVPSTSRSAMSPCTFCASGSSSVCPTPETTALQCRYPEPLHLDRASQPCSGPAQCPPAPALLPSLLVVRAVQHTALYGSPPL